MENIEIIPIGYVKNSRKNMEDDFWGNVTSEIRITDELPEECLDGIESFSHLEIIFYFDKSDKTMTGAAHPRENKDWPKVGIFAQRKKDRPNHIGTTIVELISRQGKTLTVRKLDADDNTPVLDIKPVVKEFLPEGIVRQPGWITEAYERLLEEIMVTATDKIEQVVYTTKFETPLGLMLAGANDEGICLLEFIEDGLPYHQEVERLLKASIQEGESKYFEPLKMQLDEYFNGKRKVFDLPLLLCGTDFQKLVWQELQNIPYGETRSYKEQSIALNNLAAIRAVAAANGANRIAIVVPCHRVIGENGKLIGYGGGLWRKKWLLDLEQGQLTL